MQESAPNSEPFVLFRAGGWSALMLGLCYLIITVLYVYTGTLSGGAEDWLNHIGKHRTAWWGILSLSVLTDLLFIPVTAALYYLVCRISQSLTLHGAAFLLLFVVLDLAITWPNFSVLITISERYTQSGNNMERIPLLAAATYAYEVMSSSLFSVYAVLVPALGILFFGMVMRKGKVHKPTAILGLATGLLGIIAITGSLFIEGLGMLVILTSVLTTVWVILAGFLLIRQSRKNRA